MVRAQPVLLDADDANHSIGAFGPLLICVWRKETSLHAVRNVGKCMQRLSQAHGHVGSFMVVEEEAPLPAAPVRDEMISILHSARLAYSAVTFEGGGFRAAAVRGVVTGLSLLAKPPFPHKAFATIDEAAAWATGQAFAVSGVSIALLTLLESIEFVRRGR